MVGTALVRDTSYTTYLLTYSLTYLLTYLLTHLPTRRTSPPSCRPCPSPPRR